MHMQVSQAILIADLGFGDAGKGGIVDALSRTNAVHTIVRYNGGAQAAHNVVTPGGRHHTFAQFGSGMFVPGTRTYLSRFMITHPLAMLAEERHLRGLKVDNAFARTFIDRRALVTSPFQQAANRIKEIIRGGARHGSCGLGVGETMSDWLRFGMDVLFAGDLPDRALTMRKLQFLRDAKFAEIEPLLAGAAKSEPLTKELEYFRDPGVIEATARVFHYFSEIANLVEGETYLLGSARQPGAILFEGAQGVLLDEWFGFYPYNSWSTYTFKNAENLLTEAGFDGVITRLGLIRAYATRHGAGPFVSEDAGLTALLPDAHNGDNPWQAKFRVGWLDLPVLRYSLKVAGALDGLVVTHLDRLPSMPEWRTCEAYAHTGSPEDLEGFFEVENGLVRDIRVSSQPTDLVRQEKLTRLMFEMQPVTVQHPKDLSGYLVWISRALNVPIVMTSWGQTASQKDHLEISSKTMELNPAN